MATNVINDGNAVTGDGIPVYYNTSYSSAGVTELTFQIYGPGGIAEYNPAGTAFVEYYDPLKGQQIVETFFIGGGTGPSEISISTGSLYDGDSIGQVRITFVDNPNIPGAGPGAKFLGTLGKVLKAFGYIGNATDGVFGVPGYNVSVPYQENTDINFNTTYSPEYLESLGINPNNLPKWLSPAYDAQGNFIGLDYQQCFGPEVPIDMWPLDPTLRPGPDGIYDQEAVRAKVWKKPIKLIRVGDIVASFDEHGNLVPGPVTRTFENNAKILLDFHGTRVTPGHVYYRPDSKKSYKYETLIDVLRDDGMIQRQDGTMVRAATNVPIDSPRDGFVRAVAGKRKADGTFAQTDEGRIRLGTRFLIGTGKKRKSFAVADLIAHNGGFVGEDELIYLGDSPGVPFTWDLGDTLPKPEDFVLACSGTTLEDIYKAAEWESQGPRLPGPMVLDRGPVQPLKAAALSAMPRNEPLDVTHAPIISAKTERMLSLKQQKVKHAGSVGGSDS